jgi:zinc D-Ala-D-Ala carboxypeptidase
MKLSNNLSLAEMTKSSTAQRRGIDNMPTPEHMENMKVLAEKIFQPIREHFNRPILISSGYRSKALNDAIGGSQTSQHSIGEAIDIDMDGTTLSNTDVFNYIKDNLEFDQLIWEFGNDEKPDWVHVSYKANGPQRKSILVAKKINNKTTYQKYGG